MPSATPRQRWRAAAPAKRSPLPPPIGAGLRWAADLPATGPDDVVAVLGPGIRGLAAVAAAKEAGAARVVVAVLARGG